MLCAILRNTWPKSSVLVTPTRKSIRFYRGKVSELFAQMPAQVHVIVKEDFMLQTDKDLLNIAVHNLVNNALKFANGNPIEIYMQK